MKNVPVAVVTRTKDRPLMLPRARRSIQRQTFKDLVWVIVNDAGDPETVNRQAALAKGNGIRVHTVHRAETSGMEAASNHGVGQVDSRYVVIHDDDDTWEPAFLEKTVRFLDEHDRYEAVVTQCSKIIEEINGDEISLIDRVPFNPWLLAVNLADLAMQNRFPPISMLFRRSVFDKVGGYREDLPVLGDWDFNLRVLMEGDIGVIPEPLANYHWRENVDGAFRQYGNTVTMGVSDHVAYEAIYRNYILREDIRKGRPGLGMLIAMGRMHNHVEFRFNSLDKAVGEIKELLAKSDEPG